MPTLVCHRSLTHSTVQQQQFTENLWQPRVSGSGLGADWLSMRWCGLALNQEEAENEILASVPTSATPP